MTTDLLLYVLALGMRVGWDAAEAEGCLIVDQALEDWGNANQKGYVRGRGDGYLEGLADARVLGPDDPAVRAAAFRATFPGTRDDPDAFVRLSARLQEEHRSEEGRR